MKFDDSWDLYALNKLVEETKKLNEQASNMCDLLKENMAKQVLAYTTIQSAAGGVPPVLAPVIADLASQINDMAGYSTNLATNKANILKIEKRQEKLKKQYDDAKLQINENVKIISETKDK